MTGHRAAGDAVSWREPGTDGTLIITGRETRSLLESIPSRLGSSRRADWTLGLLEFTTPLTL
jgi:hypothetical protein